MRHSKKVKYYAENRQKPQNKSSDPKKESDERRGIKQIGFKAPKDNNMRRRHSVETLIYGSTALAFGYR